jgi:hypothetical protein
MKEGLLSRAALAAVLAVAVAVSGTVIAADGDQASPVLAKSPAATSAPANQCVAASSDASVQDNKVLAPGVWRRVPA